MFQKTLYFKNITLVTPSSRIGSSIRISGEKIVAIDSPPERKDYIIDGQGGLMIPGLINAHDHLELNTFKRLKYRDCYTHSRQWIEDIEARFEADPDLIEPRRQPLFDRLLVSAAKNLLSGVTTVCHHNPWPKVLRQDYPIRVVKDYNFCHSLFRGEKVLTSYRQTKPGQPWIIHLAEGIDSEAEMEFEQLDQLGTVQGNTVLVHGVGLTPEQRQTLIERGGGLIWCPGSNYFLFGKTAWVQELAAAGKLAVGTDSRLSGEFDLLAELKVAYQTGQLSAQDLFRSITTNAARLLRLQEGGLGQIKVGGVADLVLLPPPISADLFASLFSLARSHLKLVVRGGKPVVASPELRPVFEATRTRALPVRVDGVEKLMPEKLVKMLQNSSVQEPGLTL